ncbi:hypothetical protein [Mastigocoleus sp. MO_188.B34]|nr:hypothetical protein [Mastigocoleus sp. MO_188.B34]MDJ0693776.1 hypothetical protein [Mastigocoleus sp. MO_188.B34]
MSKYPLRTKNPRNFIAGATRSPEMSNNTQGLAASRTQGMFYTPSVP